MALDVLHLSRFAEPKAFSPKELFPVNNHHVRELIDLRTSLNKSLLFGADQLRTWEDYGQFLSKYFKLDHILPDILIRLGVETSVSEKAVAENNRPYYIWDFGASPNALPGFFGDLAPNVSAHTRGVAVNLYPHDDLGKDISWRQTNLESSELFKPGDVIDQGLCIATAPYLVDPVAFAQSAQKRLSRNGSIWIAPFIHESRLFVDHRRDIVEWFRDTMGNDAHISGHVGDRKISLRLRRTTPLGLRMVPMMDAHRYRVQYDRVIPIRNADDLIADARKNKTAPKLSYMLT